MPKPKPITTDPAEPFPLADLNPPTYAEEWLAFADALERGDLEFCRRFLADRQQPIGLAPVLAMVRPEHQRLQAIVDADVPQAEISALEIKVGMMLQCHPASVVDAEEIGVKLAELLAEVERMKRCHGDADNARNQRAGLEHVFSEMLDGSAGAKACGGCPKSCHHQRPKCGRL